MDSYYGSYRTNIFTDVKANDFSESNQKRWNDVANFLADYKANPLYNLTMYTVAGTPPQVLPLISDDNVKIIYWLLYANYGNSNIASSDEFRFKQRVFTIMVQYAPLWLKKTEIQRNLRLLNDAELTTGTKSISNRAMNPQTTPSTDTLAEIEYINQQDTTGYKKSKMAAYDELLSILNQDVTQEFINHFKELFIKVVTPDAPLLYANEED